MMMNNFFIMNSKTATSASDTVVLLGDISSTLYVFLYSISFFGVRYYKINRKILFFSNSKFRGIMC